MSLPLIIIACKEYNNIISELTITEIKNETRIEIFSVLYNGIPSHYPNVNSYYTYFDENCLTCKWRENSVHQQLKCFVSRPFMYQSIVNSLNVIIKTYKDNSYILSITNRDYKILKYALDKKLREKFIDLYLNSYKIYRDISTLNTTSQYCMYKIHHNTDKCTLCTCMTIRKNM